ncbi:wnt family protein [Brugia malayi]|uniref:Protein Wnt n=2 Tax=Brugia malayi TaxID=6279 RepID=A0A1P6CC88_BRUMA|nr:wnt family protein [Brugia malayi]CTP80686.1 Bm3079 [Brugia malayi]VIO95612.1 wnt family protein [Brugia malayi]
MWFVRKRTNINLIENYTPLLYGYLLCVLLLLEKKAYGVPTTPPEKLTQGCSPELLHLRSHRHFHVLCRSQPAIAVAAYEGMQDAMSQCKEQMRFQPWDCSQVITVLQDPPILRLGTRESAYLWALSSAGAAWGVATACSQGWLPDCSCSGRDELKQNWEWGGCSYGVQFGIITSRKLLTRSATSRSPLRKLEKHNLKAGRLAVKKTLISSCKCHGVSGSCDQKTCWKKTAALSTIVQHITNKMIKARRLPDVNSPAKNAELVYMEDSPDPCRSTRITNRVCSWRNETSSQGDCGLLCCGRGFKVSHELISYQCDCQFVWCCHLKCNTCLRHRWVSTCN